MAADHQAEEKFASTVAIGQLGAGSSLVRQVASTGRPAIVTDNGVDVAVILDMPAYHALRAARGGGDLRSTLLSAMAEMEAGRLVNDATVMASVRAELDGAAPAGERPSSSQQ